MLNFKKTFLWLFFSLSFENQLFSVCYFFGKQRKICLFCAFIPFIWFIWLNLISNEIYANSMKIIRFNFFFQFQWVSLMFQNSKFWWISTYRQFLNKLCDFRIFIFQRIDNNTVKYLIFCLVPVFQNTIQRFSLNPFLFLSLQFNLLWCY